jgi:hypothetical protein
LRFKALAAGKRVSFVYNASSVAFGALRLLFAGSVVGEASRAKPISAASRNVVCVGFELFDESDGFSQARKT